MRVQGILGWRLSTAPYRCRSGPVSGAWSMFFALSLKRVGDCRAALYAQRSPEPLRRRRRSVQSDPEFVALRSVLRAARHPASPRRLAGAETALFH